MHPKARSKSSRSGSARLESGTGSAQNELNIAVAGESALAKVENRIPEKADTRGSTATQLSRGGKKTQTTSYFLFPTS